MNQNTFIFLARLVPACAVAAFAPGCAHNPPAATPAATPADAPASAGDDAASALDVALASPPRSAENAARDASRHPKETLLFFGFKPDMTVVELAPGGGWYTEILAPALTTGKGRLVTPIADPNGDPEQYMVKRAKEIMALKEGHPEAYASLHPLIEAEGAPNYGPAGSADLVLTFRSVHNWMGGGALAGVAKASFDVLKPGGVFGVVGHRGGPGADPKTGYVEESAVVKAIEAAGFKLAEKSEINANPKDTKDHPNGVWTLPPSLRADDADKEKYAAIGESDRFTLKFVKP